MHRAPTGRETLLPYSAKAKPKRRRARAAAGLLGKLLIGVGAVLLLYGLYQHSSRENGTLRWKPLRKLETVTGAASKLGSTATANIRLSSQIHPERKSSGASLQLSTSQDKLMADC